MFAQRTSQIFERTRLISQPSFYRNVSDCILTTFVYFIYFKMNSRCKRSMQKRLTNSLHCHWYFWFIPMNWVILHINSIPINTNIHWFRKNYNSYVFFPLLLIIFQVLLKTIIFNWTQSNEPEEEKKHYRKKMNEYNSVLR